MSYLVDTRVTDWATLTNISQRSSSFEFQLVDENLTTIGILNVDAERPASIDNNINRSIKRTLSNMIFPADQETDVNMLADKVRVVMNLPDGPHPIGVFMFTDPATIRSTGGDFIDATLVDQALILDQPNHAPTAFPPHTYISNAIKERFDARSIRDFQIAETGAITGGEWSVWPSGTTDLEIINDLCKQGGLYSVYFNNAGAAVCKDVPYIATAVPNVVYDLATSVFSGTIIERNDLLSAPNCYIVINNGMSDTPIYGKWNIPDSAPHSELNRGFTVSRVYDDQTVADNAAAERMAQAIGEADTSTYEWATFETAINPLHDTFDIIEWENRKYHEQSWGYILMEGAGMRHELRRAYEAPIGQPDTGV